MAKMDRTSGTLLVGMAAVGLALWLTWVVPQWIGEVRYRGGGPGAPAAEGAAVKPISGWAMSSTWEPNRYTTSAALRLRPWRGKEGEDQSTTWSAER